MRLARRMLAAGLMGRVQGAADAAVLIEDCESGWTAATGLVRSVDLAPTAGGSGYTALDILTITTGGVGAMVQVVAVDGGGAVTDVSHYAGGLGGYTTGTGKATTGGAGTGCTVSITAGNASATHSATQKTQGTNSLRISASGSAAPKRALLAYKAISPGDLSAYTQIVVDLYNSGALGGDEFEICLCSDTVGRVPVDRFTFPALVPEDAFTEHAITRDGGGALMPDAASIAIYSLSGPPTSNFYYFDNIRVAA